jgi:hypothetical protein
VIYRGGPVLHLLLRHTQALITQMVQFVRLLRGRSIICSWVTHFFSNAHNPAAWLRDARDESAQPMLVRRSLFNRGPSDTLKKMIKGLFGQILKEH